MSSLAGRFDLVDKVENGVVVGLLGNKFAKKLSYEEKEYIAGFYQVKGDRTYKVLDSYTESSRGICTNNYNDFLMVTTG